MSSQVRRPPPPPSQARLRANSSFGGTLTSFFLCLGLALPTFIYFKNKNDVKKREQYAQSRVKTGAMGLGEKIDFKPSGQP
ncbi:hypothetical protein JCM8547_000806 [Rhodosporidiobolus lusitaniae]